ncbi:MAG: hypothetical protein JNK60_19185, partial [Acidobacteria bacterium]|nr:hypothetical protein [Acidobacteriota bacterium]
MVLKKMIVLLLTVCTGGASADEEIEGGLVRLTRAAYDSLKDRAEAVAEAPPRRLRSEIPTAISKVQY